MTSPGIYKTLVEVQDPLGARDTCSKLIYISRGTNQTGIFEDQRGVIYESFGTVLIGNQWWYQRNVNVEIERKVGGIGYPGANLFPMDYGTLYGRDVFKTACPPGWRVPTREDWEQLFSNYPEDRLFEALMPGGESDFSAILGGTGSLSPGITFTGLNRTGNYWANTKPLAADSTTIWVITFDKTKGKILKGFYPSDGRVNSVRCMKDK